MERQKVEATAHSFLHCLRHQQGCRRREEREWVGEASFVRECVEGGCWGMMGCESGSL